jgi:CheY-like chemotaxis protein
LAVFIENAHLAFQVKTEMHAREHVLSIISHDLKNPLANIDLAIQILDSSRPITEASANRAIARIQNSLKSAERLIADLLDFGKIHSGHLSMKFDAVSVESIVTTAIDTFELRCAQKNLKIQSLSEFDLPAVRCDLSRIHQVMWNLIGNSIKFTPSGGEIFISAKCIDGAVQFTVADNGKGIDPVEIDKIFDRFWQSKESWEVGYGLGLSIAKGIIIAHGGKIWAEVRSEGGTKIHFTLPIHPYSKSERSNAELSQKLLQTKQKVEQSSKILDGIVVFAVDDSPEVLGLLKIFFERAGAKYYCAESVYNAVEMVRTLEPDVVLSDIEMNGANGYDFLSCIRQMGNPKVCQIPVIAMTAHSEESELGKIANAGFQFVASKPFSAEQLIKDISALPLRRRKN